MNGSPFFKIAALVSIVVSSALSQEAPDLKALLASYQEKVELEATRPHQLAVANLNEKYLAALLPMQEAAQKSGKLEQAIALKQERERVLAGRKVPDQDEAGTTDALKKMRTTYRTALARLDLNRDKIIRPMKEAFYKQLESVALILTKAGRLDEAAEAKKAQENLLNPPSAVYAQYTNSLGMKFVPVAGTKMSMCIHETSVKDYRTYASQASGIAAEWDSADYGEADAAKKEEHPVVNVSWDDAKAFCDWLSRKEGRQYRLPTDHEWSVAVGIGEKENASELPSEKHLKINNLFPWGTRFPPPKNIGNYADETCLKMTILQRFAIISGFDDGFAKTSPVMSFEANKFGIYDLGGNVWEWCEDKFDQASSGRVLRGGCWGSNNQDGGHMLSSYRLQRPPAERHYTKGFRCVLETSP